MGTAAAKAKSAPDTAMMLLVCMTDDELIFQKKRLACESLGPRGPVKG
jgi:hypothetical protein